MEEEKFSSQLFPQKSGTLKLEGIGQLNRIFQIMRILEAKKSGKRWLYILLGLNSPNFVISITLNKLFYVAAALFYM